MMVITRRLTWARYIDFLCESGPKRAAFCVNRLEYFIKVPEARFWWIEAQRERWPDGSGSRVKVRISADGGGEYQGRKMKGWSRLLRGVTRYLKQLGCTPGGPSIIIYFCLWYEE